MRVLLDQVLRVKLSNLPQPSDLPFAHRSSRYYHPLPPIYQVPYEVFI